MNVYRVSIQGMHGIEQEEFFATKESAEKRYTALIDEKRKDKSTLTDEEVRVVGYFSNNFPTFTRRDKQSCLWICRFKYDNHMYIGEKTIIVELIEVSP